MVLESSRFGSRVRHGTALRRIGSLPFGNPGHVPFAVDDLHVGGDVVAHKREHHHNHMLRHRHHIGACKDKLSACMDRLSACKACQNLQGLGTHVGACL